MNILMQLKTSRKSDPISFYGTPFLSKSQQFELNIVIILILLAFFSLSLSTDV